MSAKERTIEVTGESPFKLSSGVFEVQIAICEALPAQDELKRKDFASLWKDNFHLRVKDKKFTQTLGSSKNPLPDSVFQRDTAWLVVIDQFSSIHTTFQIEVPRISIETPEYPKSEQEESSSRAAKSEREEISPRVPKPSAEYYAGERGPRGPPGCPSPRRPRQR